MIKRFIYGLALVTMASLLFFTPAGHALTFTDDFSGGTINTFWWTPSTSGSNTIAQTGGRLVMTQSNASGGSGMTFNVMITGDFSIQVDYELVNWPANNYERIGLGGAMGPVERTQHPGQYGEYYLTHFGDGVITTGTSDMSGTLQLVRSGDTVTGSYWNGSGWTEINSYTGAAVANDTPIAFSIWNGYTNTPVTVAFDNFSIDAPGTTSPVPLPAGLMLLGPALAGLALLRGKFGK